MTTLATHINQQEPDRITISCDECDATILDTADHPTTVYSVPSTAEIHCQAHQRRTDHDSYTVDLIKTHVQDVDITINVSESD